MKKDSKQPSLKAFPKTTTSKKQNENTFFKGSNRNIKKTSDIGRVKKTQDTFYRHPKPLTKILKEGKLILKQENLIISEEATRCLNDYYEKRYMNLTKNKIDMQKYFKSEDFKTYEFREIGMLKELYQLIKAKKQPIAESVMQGLDLVIKCYEDSREFRLLKHVANFSALFLGKKKVNLAENKSNHKSSHQTDLNTSKQVNSNSDATKIFGFALPTKNVPESSTQKNNISEDISKRDTSTNNVRSINVTNNKSILEKIGGKKKHQSKLNRSDVTTKNTNFKSQNDKHNLTHERSHDIENLISCQSEDFDINSNSMRFNSSLHMNEDHELPPVKNVRDRITRIHFLNEINEQLNMKPDIFTDNSNSMVPQSNIDDAETQKKIKIKNNLIRNFDPKKNIGSSLNYNSTINYDFNHAQTHNFTPNNLMESKNNVFYGNENQVPFKSQDLQKEYKSFTKLNFRENNHKNKSLTLQGPSRFMKTNLVAATSRNQKNDYKYTSNLGLLNNNKSQIQSILSKKPSLAFAEKLQHETILEKFALNRNKSNEQIFNISANDSSQNYRSKLSAKLKPIIFNTNGSEFQDVRKNFIAGLELNQKKITNIIQACDNMKGATKNSYF